MAPLVHGSLKLSCSKLYTSMYLETGAGGWRLGLLGDWGATEREGEGLQKQTAQGCLDPDQYTLSLYAYCEYCILKGYI